MEALREQRPDCRPRGKICEALLRELHLDLRRRNAVISDFIREGITLKMEALFAIYIVGRDPHRGSTWLLR